MYITGRPFPVPASMLSDACDLMLRCLDTQCLNRPHFSEICQNLRRIHDETKMAGTDPEIPVSHHNYERVVAIHVRVFDSQQRFGRDS